MLFFFVLDFFGWLVFGFLFPPQMVIFAVLWNTLFLLYHGKAFVLPGLLFKKIFLERKGLSFTVFLRNHFILSLCLIFICLVSLLWPLCYSGVSDCTLGFCDCSNALSKDMADQVPYGFGYLNYFSLLVWFWVWIQKLDTGKSTVIQMLTWNS